jgi:hypothetical protein
MIFSIKCLELLRHFTGKAFHDEVWMFEFLLREHCMVQLLTFPQE